jgi:hypothetical protein
MRRLGIAVASTLACAGTDREELKTQLQLPGVGSRYVVAAIAQPYRLVTAEGECPVLGFVRPLDEAREESP